MSNAAFQATYADFKLIKTRGVVSVSFELPVEQAQLALDVLGGMPIAASEVWCAIARLNPGADAKQNFVPSTTSSASHDSAVHMPNSEFDSPDRGQKEEITHEVTTAQSTEPTPHQEIHPSDGAKKTFGELPYPQQAGILCKDPRFVKFLEERYPTAMAAFRPSITEKPLTAEALRWVCGVESRSELMPGTKPGWRFENIIHQFQAWKLV